MAFTAVELELIKLGVTTVVSVVVGFVTLRILSGQKAIAARQADTAAEQKKVAAAKLNLDLFDRRFQFRASAGSGVFFRAQATSLKCLRLKSRPTRLLTRRLE